MDFYLIWTSQIFWCVNKIKWTVALEGKKFAFDLLNLTV